MLIDVVLQVMVALIVHVKDEHCTAESHVLTQFVRTPHHKPHNMEVLCLHLSQWSSGCCCDSLLI